MNGPTKPPKITKISQRLMQLLDGVAEGQFLARNANILRLQSRYDITVAFASNSKPVQLAAP